MNIVYTGIRELDLIMLEDTLNREIPKYYTEQLKKAIGSEIKAGREETYAQNKWTHYDSAMALWSFGANTKLLTIKETHGIYVQILNFKQTIN